MTTSTSTAPTPTSRRLPAWTTSFGVQILAALVLGLALGLLARSMGHTEETPTGLGATLQVIGSSYVSLLKTTVIPLVFFAVVASIANLAKVTNAARLAAKTLLWFAITSLIAVVVGLVIGAVLQPGVGTGQQAPEGYEGKTGSWWAFLQGLVPSNFLGLSATTTAAEDGTLSTSVSFNVLQVLVISIAVGIAALKLGAKAQPFLDFSASMLEVIQKVLWWIIRIAPIGTVGLIGNAVASYGWDTMGTLAKFVVAIYIGLALVLLVVYPILAKAHGLSVRQYFTGMWPAFQMGFVSRSSIGTLPVTQRVAERNFGVPRGYASFAVPLGATTKMDGCAAIYPAIAALFVAQFFGLELGWTDYLLIILVSVLGSAATAGTTGGVVMLTLTLSTLGLPLAGVGLLLAVDPIVDMGRTGVNVVGQALVPALVSKQEGVLDEERYNASRSGANLLADDEDALEAADAPASGTSGTGGPADDSALEPTRTR
ncbi:MULTISPECIES: dicarboxylate/amino acid:cation symporter [Micrococcaceae]|uniref:dicarboxylate/amino acid:cation symporter n=1 Tax=Micrococcaceae TaxID=1268 RepID=UPI001608B4D2|nr:dicarboxylate/amino acid:cation symporter [Citricoccus sp.]MBB5749512.1 Na+/H+-dicarboxylate symporter [Micrococcus sp. TA1]HRO30685.1 dicarboxylate/amino acid:cation symporter [Citricoccus sp.]HRO94214.1 dicarboxylate/amino acid:cation symporter [Citricoccus sp.]